MGQSGNTMVLHSAYHYAFTFMLSSAFMFLSCMEKGKEEEKPLLSRIADVEKGRLFDKLISRIFTFRR